jgi:hypothetical protein
LQVYDTNSHALISSLDRPKHGAHAEHLRCSLLLLNERDLYIGWPDSVAVAMLVDMPGAGGTAGKCVELLAQFSTSYLVTVGGRLGGPLPGCCLLACLACCWRCALLFRCRGRCCFRVWGPCCAA